MPNQGPDRRRIAYSPLRDQSLCDTTLNSSALGFRNATSEARQLPDASPEGRLLLVRPTLEFHGDPVAHLVGWRPQGPDHGAGTRRAAVLLPEADLVLPAHQAADVLDGVAEVVLVHRTGVAAEVDVVSVESDGDPLV